MSICDWGQIIEFLITICAIKRPELLCVSLVHWLILSYRSHNSCLIYQKVRPHSVQLCSQTIWPCQLVKSDVGLVWSFSSSCVPCFSAWKLPRFLTFSGGGNVIDCNNPVSSLYSLVALQLAASVISAHLRYIVISYNKGVKHRSRSTVCAWYIV